MATGVPPQRNDGPAHDPAPPNGPPIPVQQPAPAVEKKPSKWGRFVRSLGEAIGNAKFDQ